MATRNQQIDKLMKKAPECVCDVNLLIEILSVMMTEELMKPGTFPCGKITVVFEATDEGLKTERELDSVNEAMLMQVFAKIDKPEFKEELLKTFLDCKFGVDSTK